MSEFMNEARELASQCWCDPTTSDRMMDVELAEVFAKLIARLMAENAALEFENAALRGLLERAKGHVLDAIDAARKS